MGHPRNGRGLSQNIPNPELWYRALKNKDLASKSFSVCPAQHNSLFVGPAIDCCCDLLRTGIIPRLCSPTGDRGEPSVDWFEGAEMMAAIAIVVSISFISP